MHQVPVGPVDEIGLGQRKLVFIDGRSVVLFNVDGRIHAIDNSCPHNGASLASGELDGLLLRCPAHGLRFDVETGCMPGSRPGLCVKTFPVRQVDNQLMLVVDSTP